jgi:hypothetical protein
MRVGYTEIVWVGKYQPVPVPVSTCEPNPRVDPVPMSNPSLDMIIFNLLCMEFNNEKVEGCTSQFSRAKAKEC